MNGRHRITGQNGDIDRSKIDENEGNDQTEKNTAEILRHTLKHKAREKKIVPKKSKYVSTDEIRSRGKRKRR